MNGLGHAGAVPRTPPEPPPPALSRYWKRRVAGCAATVARFHRITAALPAGPARNWLAEIGKRLDAELDAVARLATVGDSIEPARRRIREQPAKRIAARLDTAAAGFAAAVTQAAEIAEQVAVDPAHSDVNAHLEVLSRQASQLALVPEEPEAEPEQRRWLRRRQA